MSQSVTPAARTDSAVTDPRETTESSPIQTEDRQDEIAGPSTAASEPPPHQGATQSGDTAPQVYVLQPPPTFKEQVIGESCGSRKPKSMVRRF
ncbi:hypothetical protein BKA93DRAFT_327814 [Sparassis latifolia]